MGNKGWANKKEFVPVSIFNFVIFRLAHFLKYIAFLKKAFDKIYDIKMALHKYSLLDALN